MFLRYMKENIGSFLIFVICVLTFGAAFALYRLPEGAVLYPTALCGLFIFICTLIGYCRLRIKHERLIALRSLPESLLEELEFYDSIEDMDYREIIHTLCEREMSEKENDRLRMLDMLDYYTVWVHQVKTPIASMRLTMQNEDTQLTRRMSEDLFRIEQYVEMVLCYLRLDSPSTDYVFKEYSIDKIIKGVIRRLAGQFIGRGIRLEYSGTDKTAVTDEKWLSFVLEQVLSNALKYTPKGSISIYVEASGWLCVRDTGIGISPEDLPRIFEKGYTGLSGRMDKSASGLGLYLCRRICGRLGHSIIAESVQGVGTTIKICLEQDRAQYE